MRYIGSLEAVSEIEKELISNTICLVRKNKNSNNMFGVEKSLYTKRYDVWIPDNIFSTSNRQYIFSVTLLYNERDNVGGVRVKDRDIWWLLKSSHTILKIIGDMKPVGGNNGGTQKV